MKTALKLLIYSWAAIIAISLLLWHQMYSRITSILPINRYAAGLFLAMLLIWLVHQLGWSGGHKDKVSHM